MGKEDSRIRREAELSPISLHQVPFVAPSREAGYVGLPQRRREMRTVSGGVVSGLVRRLMATERARILGKRAVDFGRYALEKRTQRWREARR